MQISRLDETTLLFAGDESSFIFTASTDASKYQDKANLVIGPKLDNDFSRPGEYEYENITVIGAEQRNPLTGNANIYKVIIDKCYFGFVIGSIGKLDKQISDLVGYVNHLFVSTDIAKDSLASLINEFDPYYLTVFDTTDKEKMTAVTGIDPAIVESKVKIKPEVFQAAEYTLSGVLVTSK